MNDDLARFFEDAATLLAGVARERGPDAMHAAMATVAPDGRPEVRTVALRCADLREGRVVVQTDAATAKVESLRADPRAELLIWRPEPQLQVRMTCGVTIEAGESLSEQWDAMPKAAREVYGKTPTAGTPIEGPEAYRITPAQAAFVVLHCRIVAVDVVFLGDVHRRARFDGNADWRGRWLSP